MTSDREPDSKKSDFDRLIEAAARPIGNSGSGSSLLVQRYTAEEFKENVRVWAEYLKERTARFDQIDKIEGERISEAGFGKRVKEIDPNHSFLKRLANSVERQIPE